MFVKTGGLEEYGFLLESIEGSKKLARYSFIGVGCDNLIKFDNGIFTLTVSKNKISEL